MLLDSIEKQRLTAIATENEALFRGAYANESFLTESLVAFRSAIVIDPAGFVTREVQIIVDHVDCVAARVARDHSGALQGGGESERLIVIQKKDGEWGYSWIGEGWLCDGPHPLGF